MNVLTLYTSFCSSDLIVDLYVAVAGGRTVRADADGHQGALPLGELRAFDDRPPELVLVEDQVVRRRDDHRRVGGGHAEPPGCISDTGCRIASDRFRENLIFVDFGDVFQYQRLIAAVGDDQKIFGRDDFGEALVGVPDEAFACPQHVEKLFGHRAAADRPEPASDPAGHDDAVAVVVHKSRRRDLLLQ